MNVLAPFSSFRRRPESIVTLGAKSKIDPGLRRDDVRWMRALLIALCVFAFTLAHAVDPLPFKDRTEELRFQALTKQLRCLVCQNESLADSNAPLAADLRRDVFEQMRAGKSDAEIKQWLTARYSDFVLYDPPLRGGTFLLWFGPLLVLGAGAVVVALNVRRRARNAATAQPATRPASTDVEEDW